MEFQIKQNYSFDDLVLIMQKLRGKDGCPWDKEQTHQSIRKNFLEETYEVLEAIDEADTALLKEELGDVLLQVVFHSQIEAEQGLFSINDVCNDICQKLIVRHPHIFADTIVGDSAQVLRNWDEIKKVQKGQTTATEQLKSVPKVLPALMRSTKVAHRASRAGFDFPMLEEALTSIELELAELKQAIQNNDTPNIKEELGDLLFACTNVARFVSVDAEEALYESTDKFINRFQKLETMATVEGIILKTASDETLDILWKKAKNCHS